jgi:hypothetical protein
MSDRIGTLKRGGHSRGCHVDVAEDPKGPRHQGETRRSSVLASCPSSKFLGLIARAERLDSPFGQLTGINDMSHKQEYHA